MRRSRKSSHLCLRRPSTTATTSWNVRTRSYARLPTIYRQPPQAQRVVLRCDPPFLLPPFLLHTRI